MKLNRRTFLKTGGCLLASLLSGGRIKPLRASSSPRLSLGREVAGRCPLCSLGCGLIYQVRGQHRWNVEGDPDCPVANGSLCARGLALASPINHISKESVPLHRAPGSSQWQAISWDEAIDLLPGE